MKRFLQIFSAVIILFFAGCINDTAIQAGAIPSPTELQASLHDTAHYTTAKWQDSLQNFGTVTRGKKVQIVFHVLNTGKNPMIISDARPSCGCTIADFTKSAIAPDSMGKVSASFDSNHGMPGRIHKSITVTSNTNPVRKTLVFEGMVEDAKK